MVVWGPKPNFLAQMSHHIFLPMVLREKYYISLCAEITLIGFYNSGLAESPKGGFL